MGVTTSRILKLVQSGRIPGARRIGYRWLIPENVEKPIDARTRAGKAEKIKGPDSFRFPGYEYHESFLPRLANLSAISLTTAGKKPTASELRAHELNCIFLKNSEAYADLVPLHLYPGIAFGELGDTEKQKYHLKKALALAEKYEIYYCIAYHYYYMQKLFEPVFSEFSENFRTQLNKLSISTHLLFVRFTDILSKNSIYKLLQHGDFVLLHYAVQGLTNKEVAERLGMSVGAVGNRYGAIYAFLGVSNKQELIALYCKEVGETEKGCCSKS